MALTKSTVNDKIEVINKEISRTFHRHVVMPNADLSAEDTDVAAICTPVFSDAVKAAYAAAQEE